MNSESNAHSLQCLAFIIEGRMSDRDPLYVYCPNHKGIHLISCDEKTGIQALERVITPMKSGRVERQDSSYVRHDAQCLIANFEVATGKIITPTVGDTRTEDDFVRHIKRTIDTDPEGKWIFIADNLNTHQSEGLLKQTVQNQSY